MSAPEDIGQSLHKLSEEWLRARVRGWMDDENEYSPGVKDGKKQVRIAGWWVCTYTANGHFLEAAGGHDIYVPSLMQRDLAIRVARYINRECNFGGAWIVGWSLNGDRFYRVWKDAEGDIHIPIETDRPVGVLIRWTLSDFANGCQNAYETWKEFHKVIEAGKSQSVKIAQGERNTAMKEGYAR